LVQAAGYVDCVLGWTAESFGALSRYPGTRPRYGKRDAEDGSRHVGPSGGDDRRGKCRNAMTFRSAFNRIIRHGEWLAWNQKIRGRAGGDNLSSINCGAYADTGKYVWHYQAVPGDNWDYDATEDLVCRSKNCGNEKKFDRRQIRRILHVIDRSSGKLIFAEKFAHVTWADHVDLIDRPAGEAPGRRPEGPSSPVISVWPWENGDTVGRQWRSTRTLAVTYPEWGRQANFSTPEV